MHGVKLLDQFGDSVSLSKDGTVVAGGAPLHDRTGSLQDVVSKAGAICTGKRKEYLLAISSDKKQCYLGVY
jgi:hypothetical protein